MKRVFRMLAQKHTVELSFGTSLGVLRPLLFKVFFSLGYRCYCYMTLCEDWHEGLPGPLEEEDGLQLLSELTNASKVTV